MIMGNLMAIPAGSTYCMAARTPLDDSSGAHVGEGPALGIAHLTVVPTNFDPEAPGKRRD